MDASSGSMEKEGIALLAKVWEMIKDLQRKQDHERAKMDNKYFKPTASPHTPKSSEVIEVLTHTAHRLAFLEMVTKGLSFMEQHDAQAYAKFVEKKRKIEDLDLDELRVLLR